MGPRLVLVPGPLGDRRTWHRVVGALTPTSLLVDPRGTGETPDPGTPFGPDALTGPGRARAVAEAIPGTSLELIPACGHTPQVEQPSQLSRSLLSFLLKR